MADKKLRRKPSPPWKHIYGVDRKYTARVDRAKERGQYTAPSVLAEGTKQETSGER